MRRDGIVKPLLFIPEIPEHHRMFLRRGVHDREMFGGQTAEWSGGYTVRGGRDGRRRVGGWGLT